MRRQVLINGGLLALALGTLAAVWATRDAPTTSELAARKNKLLGSWDQAAVTRLRLRSHGKQVELLRDASAGVEGDFRIVAPWQERADIGAVNALLGSLDLASFLRSADGVDRQTAGLSSPVLEISLEMAGAWHVLRLGGAAPAPAGARYLEVKHGAAPARVVTVSAGVATELNVPLDKLRDPRLLDVPRSEMARLTITHPIGTAQLVHERSATQPSGGPAWFLQRDGRRELADRDVLARLFTALSRLVTPEFVEAQTAQSAIAKDAQTIVVTLERMAKQGPPITLRLGGVCPTAAELRLVLVEQAERAPRAGCMATDVVEALRVVEGQLVLTTPFAARVDEVQELRVSGKSAESLPARSPDKLDLVRKDSAFRLRSPSEAEVPLDAGNQRLAAIVRAAATRPGSVPDDPTFARGDGWVSIRITKSDHDSSDAERITLGKPRTDGSRCLTREADAVVLCVDAEAAKAFSADATLLRSMHVTNFAVSDVKQLSIETKTLKQRVERRDDGSYALTEPPGFVHDGALVTEALQDLGSLRAERWAAARASGEHGLDSPRLRATLALRSGAQQELQVGAATSGGYFARLAEDPGVFVLSRATVHELEAPLIDRALWPPGVSDVSHVELSRGGRRVQLKRSGEGFSADGLAPARAGELVETLRGLRADFTVHLGPARPHEGFGSPALTLTITSASGERHVLKLGARDTIDGAVIAYARLNGLNATFALAASTASALQDF